MSAWKAKERKKKENDKRENKADIKGNLLSKLARRAALIWSNQWHIFPLNRGRSTESDKPRHPLVSQAVAHGALEDYRALAGVLGEMQDVLVWCFGHCLNNVWWNWPNLSLSFGIEALWFWHWVQSRGTLATSSWGPMPSSLSWNVFLNVSGKKSNKILVLRKRMPRETEKLLRTNS